MLSVEPRPGPSSPGAHGAGASRPHRAPAGRPHGRSRHIFEPREQLRARPGLVLGLIIAGGLAVVGLWWFDTPSVHGLGDWVTNAGRILGLIFGRFFCDSILRSY